ncbi:hypothetical protein HMPREF0973_02453 [Prevotella veroralis F0319]|uniref:Uncharacterized protein n=1 Tax=Prevotella veroralis F0319 TaxID=649761 RepID=C9MS40_9BACT|nr:hypothetical protein HMPREF0973_02453 [Prevotella veroralis F0319]
MIRPASYIQNFKSYTEKQRERRGIIYKVMVVREALSVHGATEAVCRLY